MYECMYVCTVKYTCLSSKRTNQMPFRAQSSRIKKSMHFAFPLQSSTLMAMARSRCAPNNDDNNSDSNKDMRLQPDGAH